MNPFVSCYLLGQRFLLDHFDKVESKKKPGILGKDSGRLDETMRIGEVGIVIPKC